MRGNLTISGLPRNQFETTDLNLEYLINVDGTMNITRPFADLEDGDVVTLNAVKLARVDGGLILGDIDRLAMPILRFTSPVNITFSDISFANERAVFGSDTFQNYHYLRSFAFINTNIAEIGMIVRSSPPEIDNGSLPPVSIVVRDNPQLQRLSIPGYGGYSAEIDIAGNNAALTVEILDIETCSRLNVESVSEFTAGALRDVGPSTEDVIAARMRDKRRQAKEAGSMSSIEETSLIAGNTFRELSLPNLTSISGALEISGNPELTLLSLTSLSSVEYLNISGNANLRALPLPLVSAVSGMLILSGNLDS